MNQNLKVKIKRLRNDATLPTGRKGDAGWDVYASIDSPVSITPHETVLIPLGFAAEFPENYVADVRGRSGFSLNHGIRPGATPGTIDSRYRGEWMLAAHNDSTKIQIIEPNQKVAQIVFLPIPQVEWIETDELSETERGEGGFGSTGK